MIMMMMMISKCIDHAFKMFCIAVVNFVLLEVLERFLIVDYTLSKLG